MNSQFKVGDVVRTKRRRDPDPHMTVHRIITEVHGKQILPRYVLRWNHGHCGTVLPENELRIVK